MGERGRKVGLGVDTLEEIPWIKVGVGINQATMSHVHKEVEVGEKISTENGFLDVCNNEYPSKSAS